MNVLDYTVYFVTDAPERYANGLLQAVAAAVSGGASMVQYRATSGTRAELYRTALALRGLLRVRGVPLIINDHVDLALAVDADGVHVGQHDLPIQVVRRLIGRSKLLGLSITSIEQLENVTADVDYIGAGPVFATATKPDAAPPLGLDALGHIARQSKIPVVAIGGIDPTNAGQAFATGVTGVAVVSAFSRTSDPAQVAALLRHAKRPTA